MAQIVKDTGYTERIIYGIQKKARDRGYNLLNDMKIFLRYVEDAPRVGRLKKATPELEEEVIKTTKATGIKNRPFRLARTFENRSPVFKNL